MDLVDASLSLETWKIRLIQMESEVSTLRKDIDHFSHLVEVSIAESAKRINEFQEYVRKNIESSATEVARRFDVLQDRRESDHTSVQTKLDILLRSKHKTDGAIAVAAIVWSALIILAGKYLK